MFTVTGQRSMRFIFTTSSSKPRSHLLRVCPCFRSVLAINKTKSLTHFWNPQGFDYLNVKERCLDVCSKEARLLVWEFTTKCLIKKKTYFHSFRSLFSSSMTHLKSCFFVAYAFMAISNNNIIIDLKSSSPNSLPPYLNIVWTLSKHNYSNNNRVQNILSIFCLIPVLGIGSVPSVLLSYSVNSVFINSKKLETFWHVMYKDSSRDKKMVLMLTLIEIWNQCSLHEPTIVNSS